MRWLARSSLLALALMLGCAQAPQQAIAQRRRSQFLGRHESCEHFSTSIAARMRCALSCTSLTVSRIEALVSTVPLNLRAAGGQGDTRRTLEVPRRAEARAPGYVDTAGGRVGHLDRGHRGGRGLGEQPRE